MKKVVNCELEYRSQNHHILHFSMLGMTYFKAIVILKNKAMPFKKVQNMSGIEKIVENWSKNEIYDVILTFHMLLQYCQRIHSVHTNSKMHLDNNLSHSPIDHSNLYAWCLKLNCSLSNSILIHIPSRCSDHSFDDQCCDLW